MAKSLQVSSETAFCVRGWRDEVQGLILYAGTTWTFFSFKKMKETLSSLLLQKYLLKGARVLLKRMTKIRAVPGPEGLL